MITIYRPGPDAVRTIQQEERAYYWSGCAESLLRKHGLLSIVDAEDAQLDAPAAFSIVTRRLDVERAAGRPGCFEGPLAPSMARALAMEVHAHSAREIEILDAAFRPIGTLAYPTFKIRRIPVSREEESLPYDFVSSDSFHNRQEIVFHELVTGAPWRPLAYARIDGKDEALTVAVSDGARVVLGFPLFDVAARAHAFPPLNAGYYEMISRAPSYEIECWLMEQIAQHAAESSAVVVRAQTWPQGYRSAFTVRHDYDRSIAQAAVSDLIDSYDARGIKSTWSFLAARLDEDAITEIVSRGHEVNLHTVAGDVGGFTAEIAALEGVSHRRTAGYSAHGGIGSEGYLGERQHMWASDAGMLYGELAGVRTALPHPAISAADGAPRQMRLVLPPTHASLDLTTKPDGHNLEALRRALPTALNSGEHVVLMNHPDIHVTHLMTLLDELDLSTAWLGTLAEVATWCDIAKFRSRVTLQAEQLRIIFPEPLPAPTELRVSVRGMPEAIYYVSAGAREVELGEVGVGPTAIDARSREIRTPTSVRVSDDWLRAVPHEQLKVESTQDRITISSSSHVKGVPVETIREDGTPMRHVVDVAAGGAVVIGNDPIPNDWETIADRFVPLIRHWYECHGEDPDSPAARATIKINSHDVPKRADPLVKLLTRKGPGLEELRVLECGCGFGALAAYLAWQCRPREIVAVDVERDYLKVAQEGSERSGLGHVLRTFREDMRDLSRFADGSFDVAVLNNSFIYLARSSDMNAALRELQRVLAPGGRIVLYQANKWRLREPFSKDPLVHLLPAPVARVLCRLTGWHHNHGRVRLVSPLELRRRLRRAGFAETEILALRRPDGTTGWRRLFLGFYAVLAVRPSSERRSTYAKIRPSARS